MGTDRIPEIEEHVRSFLDSANRAREAGLTASRKAIRLSANAIRAVHRGEWANAEVLIEEARSVLSEAVTGGVSEHPEVRHAGFLSDAEKELAEAQLTYALVAKGELPSFEDVGVGPVEFLGGLAETVGELRRHLLDILRTGDMARAEAVLGQMDEIYDLLASIDYPDAMTRGLRSRTDAARAIIERSRSDLTMTAIQHELVSSLERQNGGGD